MVVILGNLEACDVRAEDEMTDKLGYGIYDSLTQSPQPSQ